ncbi:MAG: hypothetical protein HYX60_07650 [Legionella longbeachae]|nr:hypothetical protein [Legionella longbeachae]
MNRQIFYCFLILSGLSTSSIAEPLENNSNYWQCKAHDVKDTEWSSQSSYQKIALNLSYEQCKKNSPIPATCKTSRANCDQFIDGVNITPMWVCTALDREGLPWRSNLYPNREDAALAAQAYCKQKSPLPYTCYINLVTCMNKNEI